MAPAEFLRTIVLPTLAEFMDTPRDQRRAYLACIAAAHLVDHIDVARGSPKDGKRDVRAAVRALGSHPAACLSIVEGVSNGTKHAQPDPKASQRFKFAPGHERLVLSLSFDPAAPGLVEDLARGPGLVVGYPLPDGALGQMGIVLDDAMRAVVRAYATAFPDLFADVDLSEVGTDRDRYVFHEPAPATPESAP